MLDVIFFINIILGFLGLIAAAYTDVKDRIVPNKLIVALVLCAIAYHFAFGDVLAMFYGLAIALVVGFALYAFGIAASGDLKLFAALGALVPALPWAQSIPFPLMLIVGTIIVAALQITLISLRYKNVFRERKNVADLAEGDLPASRFVIVHGKVHEISPPRPTWFLLNPLSAVQELRDAWALMRGAEEIIGETADGLSPKEVLMLKKMALHGKIPKTIELRRTIPLVPSVLGAYALVVVLTYWIFWLA